MAAPAIAFEQVRLELGGVAIYEDLSFAVPAVRIRMPSWAHRVAENRPRFA